MRFIKGRPLLPGLLLLAVLFTPFRAGAEDAGLAGDRGGLQQVLLSHCLSLEAVYTGEFVRNLDPGLVSPRKDTIYQDNLDLTATLDTEAAGLWSGGTAYISGLFNHGGFPTTTVIGDLQAVSNIEAAQNQFIVFEAWYEHTIDDLHLSLLAGLHDMNADFYVSEYGRLFLHSSFGIGPEISRNVPTSLFSKAGAGARLRYGEQDDWYVQAGIYDGDPATRRVLASEGRMYIAEAVVKRQGGSSTLGAWLQSATKTQGAQTFGSDYGAYLLSEQELLTFGQGAVLGGFVQLGWVPKQRNDITRYLGAGLHLTGAVPMREDDEIGLATANAYTRTGTEHAIEMTWRAPLLRGVAMQPAMQWILNPGGNAEASTIRVAMLRFEVAL